MGVHDLISAVRGRREPDGLLRVRARDLGLSRLPQVAALVQFSSIGSRTSRDSLNRLSAAAAHSGGTVVVVEQAVRRGSPIQAKLGVRFTPSVYVVAADGLVTHHWARPPKRDELARALAGLEAERPELASV
jgi:thioredoxin-like negative regulator of GroEL